MKRLLNRIAIPAATLFFGLLIGAAFVEYGHRRYDRQSKQMFEQRMRCKSLADSYARENTNNDGSTFLQMVDFSVPRNSCVAGFNNWTNNWQDWELVDLLSGERTPIGSCDLRASCGNGRDIKLASDLDAAFKQAITASRVPGKAAPNK